MTVLFTSVCASLYAISSIKGARAPTGLASVMDDKDRRVKRRRQEVEQPFFVLVFIQGELVNIVDVVIDYDSVFSAPFCASFHYEYHNLIFLKIATPAE